jgi:hypothetical protein
MPKPELLPQVSQMSSDEDSFDESEYKLLAQMDSDEQFEYFDELYNGHMKRPMRMMNPPPMPRKRGPRTLSTSPHNIKRRAKSAITYALAKVGVVRPRGHPRGPSNETLEKRRKDYVDKKQLEIISQQKLEHLSQEQLQMLNTPQARKRFPVIAQALQSDNVKETLFNSTVDLVHVSERSVKPDLVRLLGRNLKSRQVATMFSMPLKTVQNIFARKRSPETVSPFQQVYPPHVTRQKHHVVEAEICTKFFRDRCALSSSFARESATLVLRMTYQQMEAQFYAQFPSLIQDACKLQEGLVDEAKEAKSPTRFQKAVLAVHRNDFAPYDERLSFIKKTQQKKLQQCAERLKNVSRVKPADKDQHEWENEAADFMLDDKDLGGVDSVRPMCQRSFLQAVSNAGIKFTTKYHPHECPIHSKGRQVYELAYAKAKNEEALILQKQLSYPNMPADILDKTKLEALKEELEKAQNGMGQYDRHQRQFEVCRDYIHSIEDNLKIGECVVYRDFVSQYLFGADFLGDKMNNLQLVLVWRDTESNCLTSFKVANFCGDKATMNHDAYFTADVFDFHLGCGDEKTSNDFSRLFQTFDTIYMVGDHGGPFSSKQTFYNESLMQTKYKKKIRVLFLCSYHAYSRADGAGAEPKRLALAAAKDRTWWNTAEDYANGITRSEYKNSIGYFFPSINRSLNIFPANLSGTKEDGKGKIKGLFLRNMCDLQYVADEVGILFYRETPNSVGRPHVQYQVHDLVIRPKKGDVMYLCVTCSTAQQKVCRHGPLQCELNAGPSKVVHNINRKAKLNDARLVGPQTAGLKTTAGFFPCRFPDCNVALHKTYQGCNKHMLLVHGELASPHFYNQLEAQLILGKKKGRGGFPCKVVDCVFDWFTSASASNKHMKNAHQSPIPNLYPIQRKARARQPIAKKRKSRTAESDDEEEEEEESEEDEESEEEESEEEGGSAGDEAEGEGDEAEGEQKCKSATPSRAVDAGRTDNSSSSVRSTRTIATNLPTTPTTTTATPTVTTPLPTTAATTTAPITLTSGSSSSGSSSNSSSSSSSGSSSSGSNSSSGSSSSNSSSSSGSGSNSSSSSSGGVTTTKTTTTATATTSTTTHTTTSTTATTPTTTIATTTTTASPTTPATTTTLSPSISTSSSRRSSSGRRRSDWANPNQTLPPIAAKDYVILADEKSSWFVSDESFRNQNKGMGIWEPRLERSTRRHQSIKTATMVSKILFGKREKRLLYNASSLAD